MLNKYNRYTNAGKEGKIIKNIEINESKSRQIKTIITSIVILAGVQGIHSSKVLVVCQAKDCEFEGK
jgi:hypothetical protein